ncbi:MAG: Asp-tRNA(Asn)/Glu-tRNA(Gln) amidotransferase subunit GatC [Gammaproteobacteria bacterium]|nr:Asp-tRNA(Asn)/Glu-tRNA(Gln) amidotransferase subunit GatC [Gammaproteobacteria bacterium]MYD80417.1 Asp-tRNA(Asn)/Glu-tRNA(Gln) amidotransferase subunit GatC [Gammaproteobacteria bacterium]
MDDATLARLGHLSRILLKDEEQAALLQDLRTILRFVDEIKSVPTKDVEPLAHPLDTVQALRNDSVIDDIERDKYQQVASQTVDGFYVVPKVIDS